MSRRNRETAVSQFLRGYATLALVTSLITNPKPIEGFTELLRMLSEIEDWEYYASRFTD